MKQRIKIFKNGHATIEGGIHGYYVVRCIVGGEVHDRIMCDDRKMAFEYYKVFQAIAKSA